MPVRYDYHMHTSFSPDSDTPMETMILKAVSMGLQGVCFTEHMDLDYPKQYGTFEADPGQVLSEINRLRSRFDRRAVLRGTLSDETEPLQPCPEKLPSAKCSLPQSIQSGAPDNPSGISQFEIGFGLEFGMQKHLSSVFTKIAASFPLDFVLASQHLVGGDDPYYENCWEGRNTDDIIRQYYQEMLSNLRDMEEWDSLAHADYIIRYQPGARKAISENRPFTFYDSLANHRELIDRILLCVIDKDKCLEVNTAGYKYGLGQPNPSPQILKRYFELGGRKITIGSDAHAPGHIAFSFEKVRELLLSIGFDSYLIFRNRQPYSLSLL